MIDRVYVCGQDLEVIEEPNMQHTKQLLGRYDLLQGHILITDGIARHIQEQTLVHELVEIVDCLFELDIPHDKITTLAVAVYMVIKDNPHLMEEIAK